MKKVLAPRASAILYSLLRQRGNGLPFLLPANICPIVPLTFLKAGAPFEFVDISPESLGMDTSLLEERLRTANGRFGGILYAHTYGDPSVPYEFFHWIKERWSRLLLIDDRCLCIPDSEPAPESVADVVLYSTGYAKIADIGFGGYAFLRDGSAWERFGLPYNEAELKAIEADYKAYIETGRPYVYHDCAWLQTDAVMPGWDQFIERVDETMCRSIAHRHEINAVYSALIPAELQLGAGFQLWRFNLRLEDKESALKQLFEAQLFASSHYRSLVGIMGEGTDVHARQLAAHVVNLFNDHHYTTDMAELTARIVLQSL
jgi:hypothetical protein